MLTCHILPHTGCYVVRSSLTWNSTSLLATSGLPSYNGRPWEDKRLGEWLGGGPFVRVWLPTKRVGLGQEAGDWVHKVMKMTARKAFRGKRTRGNHLNTHTHSWEQLPILSNTLKWNFEMVTLSSPSGCLSQILSRQVHTVSNLFNCGKLFRFQAQQLAITKLNSRPYGTLASQSHISHECSPLRWASNCKYGIAHDVVTTESIPHDS